MKFKGIIPELKMSEAMTVKYQGELIYDEYSFQDWYINKLKPYKVISVNTSSLFKGKLELLKRVRLKYPEKFIIRKDFIMVPKQIEESKEFGADAVLIIKELLHYNQYVMLLKACKRYEIEPIVEVWNDTHWDDFHYGTVRGTKLIKQILVNSRNLNTGEIDKNMAEKVCKFYKRKGLNVIYASGENSDRVVKKGIADAVLIGTAFMNGKMK